MITVKVPASSANMGGGFDCLGLALTLYNTVEMEESDKLDIYSCDGSFVPQGENNLIYRSVKAVYDLCGKPLKGLKMGQTNPIPMARGLGSSSACIAAGIAGANHMLNNPLSTDDMLSLACSIEGHPDNVSAAILGGFVTSAVENNRVYAVKHDVDNDLSVAAFVPDFKLSTGVSRAALPQTINMKDAVYNLSRAALMVAAFGAKRYDLLNVASEDMLHQKYRLPLIPGGQKIMDIARQNGALACYISGAGPTVLAIVNKGSKAFFETARATLPLDEETKKFSLLHLKVCNEGVQVI